MKSEGIISRIYEIFFYLVNTFLTKIHYFKTSVFLTVINLVKIIIWEVKFNLNAKTQRKKTQGTQSLFKFFFAPLRLCVKPFPNGEKQKTGVPKRLELHAKSPRRKVI